MDGRDPLLGLGIVGLEGSTHIYSGIDGQAMNQVYLSNNIVHLQVTMVAMHSSIGEVRTIIDSGEVKLF